MAAMTDALDWNDLKALIAAAEAGSLSAAAAQTGVSQPTLGRRIDALETALGLKLFNRSQRGMTLTDSGADMLAHARQMQEAAGRLSLAATGRAETLDGTVRITAPRVMSAHHMPPILSRLLDAEPGVEVELVASDDTENLLRREADIAIRMFRPTQADLIAKKVAEMRLGLFAADRYLARYGEPTSETLSRHRMVGYDRNPAISDWMRSHGMPPPPGLLRLRTDDQVVHWRMVVAGAGIGPNQVAVGEAEPRVRRVLQELALPILPVWLTVHEELRTSALIRRVYDFLAEELRALS